MELKNAKPLVKESLDEKTEKYLECKKNTIVRHALNNVSLSNLAFNGDNLSKDEFLFSVDIPTMSACNQKSSGRCWIFAGCNVLREIIAKEHNITSFELSQSYVAFFDRIEKVNFCLESIIDLVDKDHDDRTLNHVLDNTVSDGGQWDMFVNIIKKYGIVPQKAMPETFQSNNTHFTNSLINAEIRKFASVAHNIYKTEGIEKVRELKEDLFERIYELLLSCHGVPPKKFNFEFKDKDNVYHIEKDLTPMSFFEKYFKATIDDFVSITNAPTIDKPFNKTFTVSYLGNVVGGKVVTHLNVEMKRLKELTISQLKDGQITWFGSDCGKYTDRTNGLWDDQSFDYKTPFGLDFDFTKDVALDYRASCMNHAMVLTGVNLIDDVPTKWKVENSWGTENAFSGYYVMTDTWFDRFVFQVVINKKFLNEEELKALEKKPIVLKPWDPMGSLAD